MATLQKFEDILAWQKARVMVNQIYAITRKQEFSKDYELLKQIRRAAISILSNISEGFERNGNKEFAHFLSIATGSIGEVKAQLYIAFDQNYIQEEELNNLLNDCNEIGKMVNKLIQYLNTTEYKGTKFKSKN
jgi:four helix bundle protein